MDRFDTPWQFLRHLSNEQIDSVARDRLSGTLKSLDKVKDLTDADKKTALLLVYQINPMGFFSYREAALLLGRCVNSLTNIMAHHPDGHFAGLNIGR
jgi:hypothetical protein